MMTNKDEFIKKYMDLICWNNVFIRNFRNIYKAGKRQNNK